MDTRVHIALLRSCGWKQKEIGQELGLSQQTVGYHLSKLHEKSKIDGPLKVFEEVVAHIQRQQKESQFNGKTVELNFKKYVKEFTDRLHKIDNDLKTLENIRGNFTEMARAIQVKENDVEIMEADSFE